MNQRPGVSCDSAVWRPHTKALLVFLLAAFGSAAYPSLAEAITFADDFNRPDSPIVGNGWSDTDGNIGSNLAIKNNELTYPDPSNGGAGIFRPFPFTASITTTARVKEMSGFGTLLGRYVTSFLVRNNGTLNQGYGLLVVRSDQNTDNSQVILVEDNTQLDRIPSTFQYGPEIRVSVTFNLDGNVTGIVSEPAPSTNTFSFSFGPRTIQSIGDNFSIVNDGSSGSVDPRIDDVGISADNNFNGFFPPVDNLPVLNEVNAGRAIPVKFSLGGNQGLDIFAAGYPKSQETACDPTTLVDGIEQTVTAGSSSLSYDPITDQYNYVWKTEKAWVNTCRQLVVKLNDNSVHRANFKFK